MKRIYIVLTICLTSLISNSDIAIDLANSAGYSATDDGTGQYYIMLVANDSGAATFVDLNFLGAGDYLLASYTTQAGLAGTFGSQGVGTYATPGSGNVIIRIFDLGAADGDVGSAWEIGNASVGFTEYDSLNPGTIYSTDGLVSSPFTLGTSGTAVNVIPEPATIGLLGIAGAGLYAARRKTVA